MTRTEELEALRDELVYLLTIVEEMDAKELAQTLMRIIEAGKRLDELGVPRI